MSTQQQLTTEQVEFLTLICSIEELRKVEELPPSFIILTQDKAYTTEEYEELSEVLQHYGYLDEDDKVTTDGKQYLALFAEYLDKKSENTNIVVNNEFTLLKLDKLNIGLNAFIDIAGSSVIFKKITDGVKGVLQAIKNDNH